MFQRLFNVSTLRWINLEKPALQSFTLKRIAKCVFLSPLPANETTTVDYM